MEVHRPKFLKGFIEEVSIILLSITLAVAAERMVEHYVHTKQGEAALVRLAAEMKRDAADFNFNVNIHKNAIEAEDKITAWSKGEIEISDDSLSVYLSNALDFTFFASNTSEFESLKATSKLAYIQNHDLLSKIIVNYNRYEDFKLTTTFEKDLVQRLFAVIRPRVKYTFNSIQEQPHYRFDGASIKQQLRNNQEILNLLQEKKLLDTQTLYWNQSGFNRTNKLIKQIEEETK
jgi:Fe-S cluster assembly iron-binding protein IscA